MNEATLHTITTKALLNALRDQKAFTVEVPLSPELFARYYRECLTMGVDPAKQTATLIQQYCGVWIPKDREIFHHRPGAKRSRA